ncbi:unnamed protein product [Microthlaspi erraticum]|uniref:WEB family protein n=1 Tax=Microthlaspi erraticum TaxID=1685480 RepID=A0A6D2L7P0_9BRAS|nr:unnamed protein product [Microthlaspi erraticum]
MAEEHQNPATVAIPGTPRIREVRIESGSEYFNPDNTMRGGSRAEIDVSDQKAVAGFIGRGSWVPFKLGDNCDDVGDFDIKRMEENAAMLEKDLIVKELETLDFLEALCSTKSIVEDFKRQLQQQALRSTETPEHLPSHIKEITEERCHRKTMDGLPVIQSYVESLNMKTKEEKDLPGVASLAEELNSLRLKPAGPDQRERFETSESQCEQVKMVVETSDTALERQSNASLKTAEMRLFAARKMEEAARAAEALAIAEMNILSSGRNQDGLCFPEEPPRSLLTLQAQMNKELSTDVSRTELMRKVEEANEEVKLSRQALEAALNRVEIARVKQLEAEDGFRKWNIESWKDQKAVRAKRSMKGDNFPRDSFLSHVNQQHEPVIDLPKPVLKRNVSIGNVLNWKQVRTVDEKEKQLVTPRRKFRFIHTQHGSRTE